MPSNKWEANAMYVEDVYGVFVDWIERFYTCPFCDEPVYECDWSEEELLDFVCPICEDDRENLDDAQREWNLEADSMNDGD